MLGIVSVFVMSIGTALTTSIIAVMTIMGINLVKHYIEVNKPHHHIHVDETTSKKRQVIYILIKLAGGILLVLMGTVLLSSQPVGMSPIF